MNYSIINRLLITSVFLFSAATQAVVRPVSAGYDNRIQRVNYNANNVTEIFSKIGYLTTLRFSTDEAVLDARTGYEKGWDISFDKNTVFIMPRPVVQQYTDEYGESSSELFEPNSRDWKTNLFVVTNKRHYVIELNSIDDREAPPAFLVNYQYPSEMAKKREQLRKQKRDEQEQARIASLLEEASAPKNWDYFMRVGKGSERIAPDFAYDNGIFTYIGFKNTKLFPSAFLYINGKEQLLNYSVQNKGKYKILVIHSINDKFVLRYGDEVVGVVNKSFGKVIVNNGMTISKKVERVEAE